MASVAQLQASLVRAKRDFLHAAHMVGFWTARRQAARARAEKAESALYALKPGGTKA